MRRSYPSDISHEQFTKIKPLLLSARKITRPRELDLYDVFLRYFILAENCLPMAYVAERFSEMVQCSCVFSNLE